MMSLADMTSSGDSLLLAPLTITIAFSPDEKEISNYNLCVCSLLPASFTVIGATPEGESDVI